MTFDMCGAFRLPWVSINTVANGPFEGALYFSDYGVKQGLNSLWSGHFVVSGYPTPI